MNNSKVIRIIVKFDNIEEEQVIQTVTADYEYQKNIYVSRTQFPLSLAWALTIHKSQGLSLNAILVDLGETIFEGGQAYVALSRARTFDGVYLSNFSPNSLHCKNECVAEYNRLKRKFIPEAQTIDQYNVLPPGYTQLKTTQNKTNSSSSKKKKTHALFTISSRLSYS